MRPTKNAATPRRPSRQNATDYAKGVRHGPADLARAVARHPVKSATGLVAIAGATAGAKYGFDVDLHLYLLAVSAGGFLSSNAREKVRELRHSPQRVVPPPPQMPTSPTSSPRATAAQVAGEITGDFLVFLGMWAWARSSTPPCPRRWPRPRPALERRQRCVAGAALTSDGVAFMVNAGDTHQRERFTSSFPSPRLTTARWTTAALGRVGAVFSRSSRTAPRLQ
ncbi:MAG: hypothetical protein IPJ65_43250 [Archangiaceae bacterium]|nr:hypothetical protein [Archangiaceae bacterium]